ncbi:hypothetical protein PAXRUDRAFT_413655 [Paxillus rubicundulus Ve08.2h10]|uniref:Uncharacterized protein n=1 Tax=Paxillus rubicundulus Ve08.2h10 TaxID=930991 RepID=A0A0D0EA08_9AGAM|nr:hypothetical protein PAXRUDRAFT_413655 [Paxillus rubicundulus Ve08.2h10]
MMFNQGTIFDVRSLYICKRPPTLSCHGLLQRRSFTYGYTLSIATTNLVVLSQIYVYVSLQKFIPS